MATEIVKIRDTISTHNKGVRERMQSREVGNYVVGYSISSIQQNVVQGGRPQRFKKLKRRRYSRKGARGLGATGTGLGPVGILRWTNALYSTIGLGSNAILSSGRWTAIIRGGKGLSSPTNGYNYYRIQNEMRRFHFVIEKELNHMFRRVHRYVVRGEALW